MLGGHPHVAGGFIKSDATRNRPPGLAPKAVRRQKVTELLGPAAAAPKVRTCRKCGCTDNDCRQCIAKTGEPCYWVEADLCSACV
jgi:hypothetical protein